MWTAAWSPTRTCSTWKATCSTRRRRRPRSAAPPQRAHAAGRQVALSLSDAFCVDRHRAAFRNLVAGHVDILFANEAEICSLYECGHFEEAAEAARRDVGLAALTRSEDGSVILRGDERVASRRSRRGWWTPPGQATPTPPGSWPATLPAAAGGVRPAGQHRRGRSDQPFRRPPGRPTCATLAGRVAAVRVDKQSRQPRSRTPPFTCACIADRRLPACATMLLIRRPAGPGRAAHAQTATGARRQSRPPAPGAATPAPATPANQRRCGTQSGAPPANPRPAAPAGRYPPRPHARRR